MWLYYYIKSWFVNFVNDHAVSQWFRRHISSGSCCSFGLTCMLAWVFRGNAQHCLRKTSFYDRNMFERTDPWEALIVRLDLTTNKHICSFTFDYYYYFFLILQTSVNDGGHYPSSHSWEGRFPTRFMTLNASWSSTGSGLSLARLLKTDPLALLTENRIATT